MLTGTITESLIFKSKDISYGPGKTEWKYLDLGSSVQESKADLTRCLLMGAPSDPFPGVDYYIHVLALLINGSESLIDGVQQKRFQQILGGFGGLGHDLLIAPYMYEEIVF